MLGEAEVQASNPYLEVPDESEADSSRASRYANMSDEDALAEVKRRGIQFAPATPPLPGVRVPIRLTAPLHGVTIRSSLPEPERENTMFDIMDARLALALHDFCRVLRQHDIVEVVHFTIYRPPVTTPDRAEPQTRHPAGMAIDVGALRKKNGQWLAIGPHWPPEIGAKSCGQGGRVLHNRRGRELLSILCEAADQRIFHYMLSPHFDGPHADHLHLEIKPGVKWFLVN
jgi:hypothetical protein